MMNQKLSPSSHVLPRESALSVIEQEMKGLDALKTIFNDSFDALVVRIAALSGRVILSGIGKSGHIGRKIAATLASTGTPAYFVHPSEASHGDLGMITSQDLVICLSNSGETAELKDIIAYTRRFAIELVALVRRKSSVLAEAADTAFVLPEIPEASSIGAPTTSTTMMLAFGDALAVALLEYKGFTDNDFGALHPGGKLGKAFVKVADLMHCGDELPIIADTAFMHDAILLMTEKRFGCAGVVNERAELIGIVTDGDLRRHMNEALLQKPVRNVMSVSPVTLHQNQLAAEALYIMNSKSITSIFIVDNKKPIGIVHIHDILRAGVM